MPGLFPRVCAIKDFSYCISDCILPIISGFKRLVIYFQGGVHLSSTHYHRMVYMHHGYQYKWEDGWSSCRRLFVSMVTDRLTTAGTPSWTMFDSITRWSLVCLICGGCGSNQWRTVEGHLKKCAAAQPKVADQNIRSSWPCWKKSDQPLKNHTRAKETRGNLHPVCVARPTKW